MSSLTPAITYLNYQKIFSKATIVNELGLFLVGKFELYQQTYCEALNTLDLQQLKALVDENFAKGQIVKSGMSLAILELDYSAQDLDVKKAYRDLSLRVHPDKNLGDKRANEKFVKVKDAYDHLQTSDNLKDFQNHEFFFLSNMIYKTPTLVRTNTKSALTDQDYEMVVNLLEKTDDIPAK